MGVLDVYDILKHMAGGKWVEVSVKQLAEQAKLSEQSIRHQLTYLIEKGYIEVEPRFKEDGSRMPSAYKVVGAPSSASARVELIRAIYVRYVNERLGNKIALSYSFLNARHQFSRIADFCEEFDMDPHAYVLSCFYMMPPAWCVRTFKVPYPPPPVLANKQAARERYAGFLRNFYVEPVKENPNADVDASFHVWEKLGLRNDVARMMVFVRNGMLIPEFFICHPSVEKKHWSMAGIDENKVNVQRLKYAQKEWNKRTKK